MEAMGQLQSLSTIVQTRMEESSEVRPFPAAVAQLVAACQDPNSTAGDLERIVKCDPALAMRVSTLPPVTPIL